jgi:hypothetical protein
LEGKKMPVSFRTLPPVYSGSLKGLPGIPPPFCLLDISRHFDDYRDREKSQKHDREEALLRQRVGKIVRRLMLKAGLPLLSRDQWLQVNQIPFFKVSISLGLLEPFPAFVEMKLIQEVVLERDPTIKIEAITWNYESGTTYFRRSDAGEESVVQNRINYLIQGPILSGIGNLACTYKEDNRVIGLSYNTGPLDEN